VIEFLLKPNQIFHLYSLSLYLRRSM